ncbi:MAG: DUF427 domain-containing protein [Sneathiella sp.]
MTAQAAPGFLKWPDHFVEIGLSKSSFELEFNGTVIASSSSVLKMTEKAHDDRYYFPKDHIDMTCLTATDHSTYCPFKGQAQYWTINVGDDALVNGVWGYAEPYEECLELVDHVCFYLEKPEFRLHVKE